MDNLLKEAVEFFKSPPVYQDLLKAIRDRFVKLGRVGGTITLDKLSFEDRLALGRFFDKNYSGEQQVRISLKSFVKALQSTKFASISIQELLEAYFGEKLITQAEENEAWQNSWYKLFDRLKAEYPSEKCQIWLTEIVNRKGSGYQLALRKFNENQDETYSALSVVCSALMNLPINAGKMVRLPIFASQITRDPHSFDQSTFVGKLFQAALLSITDHSLVNTGEKLVDLYRQAGILKGDITSYVTTYGLTAIKDGKPHPLWQGAIETQEILQLTLENLIRVERVMSGDGKVYVVENPSVFGKLVEACGDLGLSFICSNGQLRVATWILLDLLYAEGVEIYYSGDFDPEGLGIAEKLLERYPERVKLWHYGGIDYLNAISDVKLSTRRLKKLEKISCTHSNLLDVKQIMEEKQLAGYQEHLVEEMIRNLQSS